MTCWPPISCGKKEKTTSFEEENQQWQKELRREEEIKQFSFSLVAIVMSEGANPFLVPTRKEGSLLVCYWMGITRADIMDFPACSCNLRSLVGTVVSSRILSLSASLFLLRSEGHWTSTKGIREKDKTSLLLHQMFNNLPQGRSPGRAPPEKSPSSHSFIDCIGSIH